MSKNRKPTPAVPSNRPAHAPVKPDAPNYLRNYFRRISELEEHEFILKKIFGGVAMLSLLLMLWWAMGSGINADDKFQVDYSQKLVNYYTSFGKDTSALNIPDGNMHLYGGFFEIVTGFANKMLGNEPTEIGYHHVRHLSSAFLGWVAILCTALLARLIAGWQAAVLTFVIMFLSPRFIGDSLMNPKDIPFAAGYMLVLYNLAAMLLEMPRPRWSNLAGLVGGLAIGLATRAGGLLPFAYLFLFAGLHWLFNGWVKNDTTRAAEKFSILKKYLALTVGTAVSGYVLAVLFWPFALQKPLSNPLAALAKFSDLEVKIRVLFEGENIMSDKTPWYYAAKWIGISIPLATLFGLLGCLVLAWHLGRRYHPLLIGMVLFAAIFPVFYVIYKNSVLHDGWRHLTFAYPPMALAAALFWNELSRLFKSIRPVRWAVLALVGLMLLDAGLFLFKNSKYPYTYFNPMMGSTEGAFGKYETDYWGVSVRQGLEYLEEKGVLSSNMTDTVTIATNMYYAAKMLASKYNGHARIRYLKWDRRCDEPWDYALFPTRFIDGQTLQKGFWPPDNAEHIITAGGAPILAVLKNSKSYDCFTGMDAAKKGNAELAVAAFRREIGSVPDNDLAWSSLANAYINLGKLDSAKICAEKAIEINPDDSQANNMLAMVFLTAGDMAGAKRQFEVAAAREASNAAAWYYLAMIAQNTGDSRTAIANIQKAIEIAPTFKPAYQLGLQIAEQSNNQQMAQYFRQVLMQLN